jgi:hypothetical protein
MNEYVSIIYCIMVTTIEWHFNLTTIIGVLTDLIKNFGSTATCLVSSCTLRCNEINFLSISLNSWAMYTLMVSSSCTTLYNNSVPCNDVRLCVWNLLIGVTCRRCLSLLPCYQFPLAEYQMPNDSLTIFSMLYSWELCGCFISNWFLLLNGAFHRTFHVEDHTQKCRQH